MGDDTSADNDGKISKNVYNVLTPFSNRLIEKNRKSSRRGSTKQAKGENGELTISLSKHTDSLDPNVKDDEYSPAESQRSRVSHVRMSGRKRKPRARRGTRSGSRMELGIGGVGSRMELGGISVGSRMDLSGIGIGNIKVGSRMELGMNSLGIKGMNSPAELGSRYDLGDLPSHSKRSLRPRPSMDIMGTRQDLTEMLVPKQTKKEIEEQKLKEEREKALAIAEEEENDEDQEKKSNKSSGSYQYKNTQSFFMYKGKGKYEDIDKEKAYRLRKIKERHKPMDYDKIRESGRAWIREMWKKKERKQKELKRQLDDLTSSYSIKYKSRQYLEYEKSYQEIRTVPHQLRSPTMVFLEKQKEYVQETDKIIEPQKQEIKKDLEKKFPSRGKNHTKWFFGRFGKQEWNKSVDIENSPKIVKLRNIKGNEYFEHFKKLKQNQEYQALKKKHQLMKQK